MLLMVNPKCKNMTIQRWHLVVGEVTLGIILLGKLPQKKIHMEETIKGIEFLKEGKENF